MYLRAADASFRLNFFKGYLGIWLQMVLIVGFGVMFSTFLSGPVAKIATIGVLVAGSKYCVGFMGELARGAVPGGGPFEALYRLFTKDNEDSDLEPGFRTNVMHLLDWISQFFLSALASLLPPLEKFSYSDYVAEGFNISADPLIVVPLVRAAAYLLPLALAGYFFLKTREIAR
jgi:hypothetical protein